MEELKKPDFRKGNPMKKRSTNTKDVRTAVRTGVDISKATVYMVITTKIFSFILFSSPTSARGIPSSIYLIYIGLEIPLFILCVILAMFYNYYINFGTKKGKIFVSFLFIYIFVYGIRSMYITSLLPLNIFLFSLFVWGSLIIIYIFQWADRRWLKAFLFNYDMRYPITASLLTFFGAYVLIYFLELGLIW